MLTDNEIIKALECCRDCKCKECPCYKNIEGEMRCTEMDEEKILDLLNRQKAEINGLIAGQETLQKCIAEKEAEIEQRENYAFAERDMAAELYEELKTVRAEAIKEFADRLKAKAYEGQGFYSVPSISDIDNLVKEMVGDAE